MKYILFFVLQISCFSFGQNRTFDIFNDSILLVKMDENLLFVSKNKFEEVINEHPEFLNIDYNSPDILYAINSKGFESEVGQDDYYLFYAYFLSKNQNSEIDKINRNKLLEIYTSLNRIYALLDNGGTGFAHLYKRIFGYAEYSLLIYNNNIQDEIKVDFKQQKTLFIKNLELIVSNRLQNEWNYNNSEKKKIQIELNKLIEIIKKSITDSYLLLETQKFMFSTYQTY